MPQDPDNFIAGLMGDLRPVRVLSQRDGMVRAVLAMLGGVAAIAVVFGLRDDVRSGHPGEMLMLSGGLFGVLALASAWCVIAMARPHVGTRRDGWGWTALMAAVLPVSALLSLVIDRLNGLAAPVDSEGIVCLTVGTLIGLLTAAALTLWLRCGAPTAPGRAGLMTGVAAGAAGIFAVSLDCPHDDLLHIGLWHGCTVLLSGLLGRLIVPRLIRW